MDVKQVYEITNAMAKEFLGETAVVAEDLSNVVDIGSKIFETTDVDNYVKKLIDKVGRVIFVNRQYTPILPSVEKSGWEFGSILQKVDCDMFEAQENPEWELYKYAKGSGDAKAGKPVDQDLFTPPTGVRSKFFNDATTYEVPFSITEEQVKESFNSAEQLNGFFSMIQTKIKNSLVLRGAGLTRAVINNMIAATVYREFSDKYSASTKKYTFDETSGIRAVNLLALYRDKGNDPEKKLTPETCLNSLDFLKFACYQMKLRLGRVRDISTLFNIGKKERFTPTEMQHFILLEEFAEAAKIYLQSDTFHNELVAMPKYEAINFWQGTGEDYGFSSTSTVHVSSKVFAKDADISTAAPEIVETEVTGVLGVFFDNDALGINNYKSKVTNHYNGHGDFRNYWYKQFARYFNDYDENAIVFFVA